MTPPPASDGVVDVIRTSRLRKVYPGADFAAVDGIDLRVRRGEIFGLLGPNGAGKTTTVGMLTGRVVPTSGTALIGTVDVVAQPARAKQIIAAVTQENTLDRALDVRENLYYHGLLFGIPARASRERADALLDEFRLARWARSSVYALSGGMAQRLMLARAVFHRPAVLFLDEPTAGLDPQGRLALWESLAQLMADGQTILLTTHNMEEADRLCDRVAIIDHGRILALDTPAALKQGLGADTTVTVVAKGPAAELAAVLRRDVPEVVRSRLTDGGVELQVKGNDRLLARVVASAEAGGFDLVDLSLAQSSLETVFISLTGKELRE
ncbi:ATP-binding cassette domain-containing protein [Streptomyces sp. NPDC047315]|uniref:ABC transporter ATP-binding protein n=1 Tax=Streptomyces sp. NPDC047315 TaxID=3155142 RepID=UPI0034086F39